MREILFKAKRIDNGEWVEGNIILSKDADEEYKAIIIPSVNSNMFTENSGNEDLGFENWYKVDSSTICQYTGLTDKNGQKIWENDVVIKHFYTDYDNYANSEEYIGFVKFEDCAWVIETKVDNRICTRPIIESIAYSDDIKYFEVFGNIFDNPDLLNE